MGDSIFSLLILLFIFFVVPSLLKMLGQHSLKTKQEAKKFEIPAKDKDEIIIESPAEEHYPEHHEERGFQKDPSNKPIKPRMF